MINLNKHKSTGANWIALNIFQKKLKNSMATKVSQRLF